MQHARYVLAWFTVCLAYGQYVNLLPTQANPDVIVGQSQTSTGFYNPAGATAGLSKSTNQSNQTTLCSSWLTRDTSRGGCYLAGNYHIGQDLIVGIGSPVRAIADGEIFYISRGYGRDANNVKITSPIVQSTSDATVKRYSWGVTACEGPDGIEAVTGWKPSCGGAYGRSNVSVLVKHKLQNGTEFLALYGHVLDYNPITKKPFSTAESEKRIPAGEQFAYVGGWYNIAHLHFGILPNTTIPANNLGLLPEIGFQWPETNGFVDPVAWLTDSTRLPNNYLGAQGLLSSASKVSAVSENSTLSSQQGEVSAIPASLTSQNSFSGNVLTIQGPLSLLINSSNLKILSAPGVQLNPGEQKQVKGFVWVKRAQPIGAVPLKVQALFTSPVSSGVSPSSSLTLQVTSSSVVSPVSSSPVLGDFGTTGGFTAGSPLTIYATGSNIDSLNVQGYIYGPGCPSGCQGTKIDATNKSYVGTFTPTQPGIFQFKLRNGQSGPESLGKDLTVYTPVQASCSASHTTVPVNTPVTYTATATGGLGPYSFNWEDGATGSGISITTSYQSGGMLAAVGVTVTDQLGNQATATCGVGVNLGSPSIIASGYFGTVQSGTMFSGYIRGYSFSQTNLDVWFCKDATPTECYQHPSAGVSVSASPSESIATVTYINLSAGLWRVKVRNGTGPFSALSSSFNVAAGAPVGTGSFTESFQGASFQTYLEVNPYSGNPTTSMNAEGLLLQSPAGANQHLRSKQFYTGDFTARTRLWYDGVGPTGFYLLDAVNSDGGHIMKSDNSTVHIGRDGTGVLISKSLLLNRWNDMVIARTGSNVTIMVNGVSYGPYATSSAPLRPVVAVAGGSSDNLTKVAYLEVTTPYIPPAAPTLSSVDGSQLKAGQLTPISVTGTNFDAASAILEFDHATLCPAYSCKSQAGDLISRSATSIHTKVNLPNATYSMRVKNADGQFSSSLSVLVPLAMIPGSGSFDCSFLTDLCPAYVMRRGPGAESGTTTHQPSSEGLVITAPSGTLTGYKSVGQFSTDFTFDLWMNWNGQSSLAIQLNDPAGQDAAYVNVSASGFIVGGMYNSGQGGSALPLIGPGAKLSFIRTGTNVSIKIGTTTYGPYQTRSGGLLPILSIGGASPSTVVKVSKFAITTPGQPVPAPTLSSVDGSQLRPNSSTPFSFVGTGFDIATMEVQFDAAGTCTGYACKVVNGSLTTKTATTGAGPAILAQGTYNARVKNGDGQVSESRQVTVTNPILPLSADCSVSPNPVNISQQVTLRCNNSGGVAPYTTTWSGDYSGTGSLVYTSFSAASIKTITATVRDSSGQVQTQVRYLTVQAPLSNVYCVASPSTVQTGQSVTFTAYWSGGSGSPGFSWTNYVSGTTRTVTTSFSSPGTYTANLLVMDLGQQVNTSCSVTVQAALANLTIGSYNTNPSPVKAGQVFNASFGGTGFVSGMTAQYCNTSFTQCWTVPASVASSTALFINGQQWNTVGSAVLRLQRPDGQTATWSFPVVQ